MKQYATPLKEGMIGVDPTDTLYGIVGVATDPETIEKIYDLKGRDQDKPFIILINSIKELKNFEVSLSEFQKNALEKIWPGKVSVILKCSEDKFSYLHRGKKSLAFRVPDRKDLLELLKLTGPLVAPSANPQGKSPAKNISEAEEYFGQKIDLYIDGGELSSPPSTLVEFAGERVEVLRGGAVDVKSVLK